MTINPFVAGVFVTVFALMAVFIAAGIVMAVKKK